MKGKTSPKGNERTAFQLTETSDYKQLTFVLLKWHCIFLDRILYAAIADALKRLILNSYYSMCSQKTLTGQQIKMSIIDLDPTRNVEPRLPLFKG